MVIKKIVYSNKFGQNINFNPKTNKVTSAEIININTNKLLNVGQMSSGPRLNIVPSSGSSDYGSNTEPKNAIMYRSAQGAAVYVSQRAADKMKAGTFYTQSKYNTPMTNTEAFVAAVKQRPIVAGIGALGLIGAGTSGVALFTGSSIGAAAVTGSTVAATSNLFSLRNIALIGAGGVIGSFLNSGNKASTGPITQTPTQNTKPTQITSPEQLTTPTQITKPTQTGATFSDLRAGRDLSIDYSQPQYTYPSQITTPYQTTTPYQYTTPTQDTSATSEAEASGGNNMIYLVLAGVTIILLSRGGKNG
jgi:hypothetical protein